MDNDVCMRCGRTRQEHVRAEIEGVVDARGDHQPLHWSLESLADCLSDGGFVADETSETRTKKRECALSD